MRIIIKFLYKILSKIIYRVEVIGKENLPKEKAAIICPNHVHFLDGPTLIANSKRKINVLAKEELFKNKFLSNCLRMLGMYPIKRGSADIEAIKVSLKILKNNELLMIFPEGTRNGMAKGVKPKNGAVVMAIKAGVPIIPVGIIGNFKPFRKITMKIGKPIDYRSYRDKVKDKELMTKLTEELMKKIVKLTNDAR